MRDLHPIQIDLQCDGKRTRSL